MPWLPAPTSGEQEAAVCKIMTRWSGTWIASAPKLRCVALPRSAAGALRWHGPAIARVGITDDTEVSLGYAACAGRAERANPRDRDLLKQIGADMVRDLAQFMEDAIGPGLVARDDDPADACFQMVAQDDAWSLALAVRPDALVRLRQAAAGRKRKSVFGKMSDSLTDLPIRLGCHLGAATLTADQVASLAVGDLIVLDNLLDAALPLLVARDRSAGGSAQIHADDGTIAMTIVESPSFLQKAS